MKKKKLEFIPVLLIVVEFLVMSVVAGLTFDKILSSMGSDYAKSLVNQSKQYINEEMNKPIIVGQTLATYPAFISALEDESQMTEEEFVNAISSELNKLEDNLGDKYSIYLISDGSRRYVTSSGLHKIVDVQNDEHDIWYSMFLENADEYSMDIDIDQSRNNAWTAFVNCRIFDSNDKFVGCLAIAYDISNVHAMFKEIEETYSCAISVYDANRNLTVSIENVSKEAYYNIEKNATSYEDSFKITRKGFSTVTYLESLGWWIIIEDDNVDYFHSYLRLILLLATVFVVVMVIMIVFTSKIMKKETSIVTKDAQVEGLGSLASIYYSMHLINLATDEYLSLKQVEGFENYEGYHSGKDAKNAIVRLMSLGFGNSGHDFSKIIDFCNLDTIEEKLNNKTDISREFVSNDGNWYRARFIAKDYDISGKLVSVIYALENINEQKRYEKHLKELSETDKLTGITNRGHGETLFEDMFLKKQAGTMLIMDGDHFKDINDTYGHSAGDEVIITIARVLKESFTEKDIVMRLGGDEFAVYIVGEYTYETVKPLVDRFIKKVSEVKLSQIGNKKIEMSIGALMYDGIKRTNFETMYKHTDKLLYESKLIDGSYCKYDTFAR